MKYKRFGRFVVLLLVLGILLEACGADSGEINAPPPNTSSTTDFQNSAGVANSTASSTTSNVPSVTAVSGSGTTAATCMDVKSRELYPGLKYDKYLCLEGTITDIQVDASTKTAQMNLDTTTGNSGGSLYSVEIYIGDVFGYGVENLDNFFNGVRVRVKGTFVQGGVQSGYIKQYLIKVSRPNEIEIIL